MDCLAIENVNRLILQRFSPSKTKTGAITHGIGG